MATVTKDGEPVVHNLARGGVLRVDPPPSPEKVAAAKAKPDGDKPKVAAANRLEQLRQEAAAKNAK